MLGYLEGNIQDIEDGYLIVNVHGVGYLVYCSRKITCSYQIGNSIQLIIDTHVREDQISLYGFKNKEEKNIFKILTTVKGVGARVALAILGDIDTDNIIKSIYAGDILPFTHINGIGKRLAERIVNELKNTIIKTYPNIEQSSSHPAHNLTKENNEITKDLIAALVNLGYNKDDAYRVVTKILSEHKTNDLSELIKLSLRELL